MDTEKFPRGPGPLISILLPTRGRPEHLTNTIASLHNTAVDKAAIEYLLWIDADDQPTVAQALHLIAQGVAIRFIVGPRVGYKNMQIMVNKLCAIAEGDWLWLFNDDALCRTEGWDQQIANMPIPAGCSPEIALFGQDSGPKYSPWLFPVMRREAFKILGHYSRHCCNDSYVQRVFSWAGAFFVIQSIFIEHLQDTIIDDTRKGTQIPSSNWDGPGELLDWMQADAAKLRARLEARGV
jgi:hypothetical protein